MSFNAEANPPDTRSNERGASNSDCWGESFFNSDDYEDCQSPSSAEDTEHPTQCSPNVEWAVCLKEPIDLKSPNHRTREARNGLHGTPTCNETQPPTDRRLSGEILALFGDRREQEVIQSLKRIQKKQDEIWRGIDQRYKNYQMKKEICRQMRNEYDGKYRSYLSETFGCRVSIMEIAMNILNRSSFGVLILNSKNQILAVQNAEGTFSAPKGHVKINDNDESEIALETAWRELFEEISIKLKRSTRITEITKENYNHLITLTPITYLQCNVDSRRGRNDQSRLIGLFVYHIDEKKLRFQIVDKTENQNCVWLEINEILNNQFVPNHDGYYTLRPFVKYLKDHPELLPNH